MATTGERGLGGAGETSSGMAGQRGICKYNQTGFCKFKGSCPNIHDNEICNVRNCSPNLCTKRHPKECRYFADYKYCKFRACTFAHSEIIEKGEVNALREEINYMKHEIGILKLNMSAIRQESNELKSAICILKEEIEDIKRENFKTESKIISLEKEFEDESEGDDEKEENHAWQDKQDKLYSCKYCNIQINTRTTFDDHMKSHIMKGSKDHIKCTECEYSCKQTIALKKHINTKHQVINEELGDTESESEDDFDLFQLEIVSDEEVYVCNLCNEGLDSAHEVKEHLKETHKKVFEHGREHGNIENVIEIAT